MNITNKVEAPSAGSHTVAAMKEFIDTNIGNGIEGALFTDKTHAWFFADDLIVNATIGAPESPTIIECLRPSRDCGLVRVTRQDDKLGLWIGAHQPISLEATGANVAALGAVLPFLLGGPPITIDGNGTHG